MKLPKLAIDNAAFTWMFFILLTIIGVRSLLVMPRTENPEISVPGASIIVILPGANPVDMEKMVVLPIEESVNELEEIDRISTSVRDGLAVISVEFDFNTDADEKFDQVARQVNNIRNDLPDEIMDLEVWQWTTADMSMYQLALISDSASFTDLRQQAEKLRRLVEKNKSVRKVDFYALPEREIHIFLDFEKMARINTSIEHVTGAIESNNANIPGGEVEIGDRSLSVKSSGSYQDLDEIRNTAVNSYQGRLIHLKDIATVAYGYEELNYKARYSGKRTIFIGICQKEKMNVLRTGKDLLPVIEQFEKNLPDGMELAMVFDQPARVRKRINGFLNNLFQGIILVGLVIFLSLGVRSSLVVVIAIPLSIVIGLGIVDHTGYGLQQISIAALVVALGLLVDNSIVMVENINRFIARGHPPGEASVLAASEIGWPVVTATLTTILAFVPLAAMPYMAGAFIRSLPLTIMFTLTASLLVALTLTPVITSRLFKVPAGRGKRPRGFRRLLEWVIAHPFRASLRKALKYPALTVILAVIFLGGSAWAFRYVGISFFPKSEQPNLMIQATLPEGTNIGRTDEVARYIEYVLDTMPQVKYYATNVGHGNPQIYYNVFPKRNDLAYAEVYVECTGYSPEGFERMIGQLRDVFGTYPGARIRVKEFEQGPPVDAPVQVFITGNKLEVLRRISTDLEAFIARQPGVINLENHFVQTNTELLCDINREKASMLGIPVIEIDRTIRTAISGIGVSKFRDRSGEEHRIVLKMGPGEEFRPEDLDRIYVSSLSGRQVQLTQLVRVRLRQVPSTISRYNMERTAEVTSDIESGFTLDEVMDPVIAYLEQYDMPAGYSYIIGGELESRTESFGGITNAILIAIVSILAVLVLQFRSFRQPFIVFLAIPFAATGMVWALLITGLTFSFTAFIGLTSLVGIVVNNSIILVDYINKLRERGLPLQEALQQAAETRLTPIVLTALTTIGGLIPLTLRGGTLWAPMGWTIIGGLLVSTLLTLVLVPVFYRLMEKA
jgi:multidrug efflux pump subunit AcrB